MLFNFYQTNMSLFQASVLKKYLKEQDKQPVNEAYEKYKTYFFNPDIQQNIRDSKEEQFQEGFLRELFVNIFGYTINPDPDYNLTTEYKNETGSKKADGAVLQEGKAIGVIELKSTKTKDLESIRQQAFDYKANQSECVYVITSNFEKLRFYINNAVDFEEFDLFNITLNRFELLYLCLHQNNIFNNLPLKIKEESVVEEEVITKKIYADYSLFKRELYQDLINKNLNLPLFEGKEEAEIKLLLFKKSQKLLDRFLFIFFAEDKGLLPPNSIPEIIKQWEQLKDLDAYAPLYERYKKYFSHLNEGWKGKKYEIYGYNGGLFLPDEVLSSIAIDDELLKHHTNILSAYDFNTDVDVNILGHIFENSLNEIEEITAQLEGQKTDSKKSKRKKDGVYYTPKYITKYIVDNTVGKLCEEKKKELEISDEFYSDSKRRSRKRIENLDKYRQWLLELTICDPACGSGAFLNQALEFLINEHRYLDELTAKYHNTPLVLTEIENTILENNLYGVDINEESIEIAKLSLWLRTAQKGRKLTTLSNNIKCGNSLIDDPEVAGDKAFNWNMEFPNVFTNGGFDVVIGNPPYVRQELFKDIKPYLQKHFECYNSIADLYTYFIEKGIRIIRDQGKFSFILPNKFMRAKYGNEIRSVILAGTNIELIFDFDDFPVFDDATTYPIIFIFSNRPKQKIFFYSAINKRVDTSDSISTLEQLKYKVKRSSLISDSWNFVNIETNVLLDKLTSQSYTLKKYVSNKIFRGVSTGCNEVFIVNEETKNKLNNSHNLQKILMGKEVKRYTAEFQNLYLLFLPWEYDINSDEKIKEYLYNNKDKLEKRPEVKEGRFNWWCLSRYGSKNSHLLSQPKIIYPRINSRCNFFIDETGEFSLSDNNFFISTGSKALLALLNSSLTFFYLKNNCSTLQGGYWDFRRPFIEKIPIHKKLSIFENELDLMASSELLVSSNLQSLIADVLCFIKSKFNLIKPSKKLQTWHELDIKDFLKELKKAKVQLSLSEEADWMQYFNEQKQKAQDLKSEIDRIDKEIDQMVYELYGLTENEIKIVEESTK